MSKRVLQAAALVILFVFQAIAAIAEVPHWKIRDIKPGMHGYGKSVFKGDEPERFDVEFLGNLQSGDKTYFIVRVSGGPGNILQAAGVTAGMSGSPIYVNDKLVGALSFAFPFAKDGIGGVTPFESMYAEEQAHAKLPSSGKPAVPQPFFLPVSVGGQTGFMSPIPVFNSAHGQAVYGIDRNTMAAFSYEGASQENHPEEKLIPGSAISVALITGDVVVRATGTVTAVDGDTVYAFGHPFFGDGPVQFSAWRTPILTLVPMLSNSFKLPSSTWVGERAAITYDGAFGIYGTIGGKVETVPLAISFEDRTGRSDSMNVELPYGKYLPLFAGYMTSLLEGRYPGYAQRANLAARASAGANKGKA